MFVLYSVECKRQLLAERDKIIGDQKHCSNISLISIFHTSLDYAADFIFIAIIQFQDFVVFVHPNFDIQF